MGGHWNYRKLSDKRGGCIVRVSGMEAHGISSGGEIGGRPRRPVTSSEEIALYKQNTKNFFNIACHTRKSSTKTHKPCFLSFLVFKFSKRSQKIYFKN